MITIMKKHFQYMLTLIIGIAFSGLLDSCKKVDTWLDEKSNLADVRPATLADFQAILDDMSVMNNV